MLAAATVNLESGWAGVWSDVQSIAPGFVTALTTIALLLMVGALVMFFWERRKGGGGGGGQGTQKVLNVAILAGILAAPDAIIPLLLKLVDYFLNFVVAIFT